MINDLPFYLIFCLLGTIIIEMALALILKVRKKGDILIICLVNILTNPLVVIISTIINIYYGKLSRNISLLILEILAIISEGFIYHKNLEFKKIKPYLLSFILNIASYSIGLIINWFI